MKLRSGAIIGDTVPAANTNKRNQTTTIPYARRRKVINYEDEVIECAYDGTTSGDDRESPSGDESNNETPPPTTHSSVRGAYEALPKAIIHRKYRGTDDEEIDLRIGEYITNIKYTEKEYWMGTDERGDTGFFPCGYVRIIQHKNEEEAAFRFLDLPGEIRNKIYGYLVIFPGKRTLGMTTTPPITQTSRLVRQESLSIFYSKNMWIYRPMGSEEFECFYNLEAEMMVVSKPYIPFLHDLEVEFCYCLNHGSSSLFCKLDPFPDAIATLKWAGVACTASERDRQLVLRRVHVLFDKEKLSGDMERTIHFDRVNLLKIFDLIDSSYRRVNHPLTYSCV